MKRPLSIINQTKYGSELPINRDRRVIIGGGLTALLASPLIATSRPVMAQQTVAPGEQTVPPNDPFILLLTGLYRPVLAGRGPSLGLSSVNLNDGTYSVTQIYPIFGIGNAGGQADQSKAIGNFYVQFAGSLCAYQLPEGAIAMSFDSVPAGAPPGFNAFVPFPDGNGGNFLEGTFELTILEATGIYQAFKGGHNHMVDKLHQLPNNAGFDEFCFCNISTYQFP